MRRRNPCTWILLALLGVPGCLFRPIFHPPTATNSDGGPRDAGSRTDTTTAADAPLVPSDDCAGFYDSTTGEYAPDAHHADGAVCRLPSTDAGHHDASTDATPQPDVEQPDVGSDTATDATADDASSGDADDSDADASAHDATSGDDVLIDDADDAPGESDAGDPDATE